MPSLHRFRIRGKDGRVRFNDTETGFFTKNPFSSEQLAEARKNGFDNPVDLEASTTLFERSVAGDFELVEFGRVGSGDDFARAGVLLAGQAGVKGEAALNKDGLELSGSAGAFGEVSFASGQVQGDLGKASFDVASTAEAKVEGALTGKLGGPLGVQGDVSVGGKAEAVALKFSGSAETSDVSILFGIVDLKAKVDGDFNVLGAGISGEAGIATLKSKPGVRVKVGAGATALIGGKIKGSVEISFNKDNFFNAVDNTVEFIRNIDLNPFDD